MILERTFDEAKGKLCQVQHVVSRWSENELHSVFENDLLHKSGPVYWCVIEDNHYLSIKHLFFGFNESVLEEPGEYVAAHVAFDKLAVVFTMHGDHECDMGEVVLEPPVVNRLTVRRSPHFFFERKLRNRRHVEEENNRFRLLK